MVPRPRSAPLSDHGVERLIRLRVTRNPEATKWYW
jgi:hypothetical protein